MKFQAAFGDEIKTVKLSQPYGGGAGNYHIMIDNFYAGGINKMLDGWRVWFNRPDDYTKDDEDALLERLGLWEGRAI